MKKYFLPLQTVFFCIILAGFSYAAEVVNSIKSEYVINKDGTVSVTEIIEYNFGTDQRHGIYRNIPFKKINDDGKKYVLTISDVKVADATGRPYIFSQSKEGEDVVLKIGDPARTISGVNIYQISYTVSGALTYFEDFDEFYWNSIGPGWKVNILNSQTEVSFEEPLETQEICYTGVVGGNEQNCTIQKYDNKIVFEKGVTRPGEAFTVVVKFPKGYAALLDPKEDKMPLILVVFLILLGLVGLVLYLFLPLFLLFKWKSEKNKLKNMAKIVSAWFSAPKTPSGESLTPIETVITADITSGSKALSATIISLAQKGYINIIQKDNKKFAFSQTSKLPDTELRPYEKKLYDAIFKTAADEVLLKDLNNNTDFYTAVNSLAKDAGKYLETSKVFNKNPYSTLMNFSVLGFMALVFFNIPLALVLFFLGRKSAKRTEGGIQTYSEAVSLKNFLVSQDPQFDFQAQEMMFFEKLLPYATAFGVEDIWIKRFKELFTTPPDWYKGDDIAKMALINRAMTNTVRAASASSRSSSGFSSGFSGGSSGGGGGGGGGGSW